MSERPTCGKCGGKMTPENSMVHPELFLHDGCLPEELQSWRQRLPATDFSYNPADLKSEVERLKVDLKEAQAAAAVMREALDGCAKHFGEMEDVVWNDDSDVTSETFLESQKSVQAALSTTAGTAFLARMSEAEWLVENVKGVFMANEWASRRDAFLKGEGVKACHLEDCSIYSTAKICDCPYSRSTISKQDVDQAMRDATHP